MSDGIKGAVVAALTALGFSGHKSLPTPDVPADKAICNVVLSERMGVEQARVKNSEGKTLYHFTQGTDVFGPKYTGEGMIQSGGRGDYTTVGPFSIGVEKNSSGKTEAKTCTVDGNTYIAKSFDLK